VPSAVRRTVRLPAGRPYHCRRAASSPPPPPTRPTTAPAYARSGSLARAGGSLRKWCGPRAGLAAENGPLPRAVILPGSPPPDPTPTLIFVASLRRANGYQGAALVGARPERWCALGRPRHCASLCRFGPAVRLAPNSTAQRGPRWRVLPRTATSTQLVIDTLPAALTPLAMTVRSRPNPN